MAGITDSKFVKQLIPYGFDMVTIGGYNVDEKTIKAGEEILKKGNRKEFKIDEECIINHIEDEVNNIKEDFDIIVSANLRATTPDPIVEISKIKELDVIELNAHCRQEELTNINCGQEIMKNPVYLEEFIKELTKKSKSKVSVKIRANVEGINTLNISKIIDKLNTNFLHLDCMKPGSPNCDLEIIKKINENTDIFIIGNNSIIDINSAKNMLSAGASGISIARATLNGKLSFNLNKIKNYSKKEVSI
ncbi:MAG: tRNA-dihydrouridine synthase [Methanobrevibacter sp.]|jgi:TIM-barrel protein|nr:tRNA-dihydrouridine synthase [Candidatus Methanovirga basalitermitum]